MSGFAYCVLSVIAYVGSYYVVGVRVARDSYTAVQRRNITVGICTVFLFAGYYALAVLSSPSSDWRQVRVGEHCC